MNIRIIQQLSYPTDCTVCGEPAYSAALCKLHYRKAYKPIGAANFSPTERRDIARQYWRQKKADQAGPHAKTRPAGQGVF